MNIIEKFVTYIRSSKQELTKVTWPNKQVTTRYSVLVIVISLGVAAFFGVLDVGLTKLVNKTVVERAGQSVPAVPQQPVQPTTVPIDSGDNTVQPTFDFSDIDADMSVETLPIENNQ